MTWHTHVPIKYEGTSEDFENLHFSFGLYVICDGNLEGSQSQDEVLPGQLCSLQCKSCCKRGVCRNHFIQAAVWELKDKLSKVFHAYELAL